MGNGDWGLQNGDWGLGIEDWGISKSEYSDQTAVGFQLHIQRDDSVRLPKFAVRQTWRQLPVVAINNFSRPGPSTCAINYAG